MMSEQRSPDRWNAILKGMVEGAKETPREFFAPMISLWRWLGRVSAAGLAPPASHFTLSPEAARALSAAAAARGLSLQVALELAIYEFRKPD